MTGTINFGKFKHSGNSPLDGGRLLLNEAGDSEFFEHYSRKFSRLDIYRQFVGAEHPLYCVVEDDGRVRVVNADPSRAAPVDCFFIATDDTRVEPEWRYDFAANTFSPPPPPPYIPISIAAGDLFFERFTDEEYDQLQASLTATESARMVASFNAAPAFTEASAMWELLDKHLALTVSAERKAELLARPGNGTPPAV